VSERELHTLGFLSATGGFLLACFGTASGVAASLGITLYTVPIQNSAILSIFWGLFGASAFGSFVLLIVCVLMTIRSFRDVSAIKKNSEQEKRQREFSIDAAIELEFKQIAEAAIREYQSLAKAELGNQQIADSPDSGRNA
jgi:hypothetical protein